MEMFRNITSPVLPDGSGVNSWLHPGGQVAPQDEDDVKLLEDIQQLDALVCRPGSRPISVCGESEFDSDSDGGLSVIDEGSQSEQSRSERASVATAGRLASSIHSRSSHGASRSIDRFSPERSEGEASILVPLEPATPVFLENCLAINRAYQELIIDAIERLGDALLASTAKQERIRSDIESSTGNTESSLIKRRGALMFGAPYFKDINYFPCPQNPDTIIKAQLGELDPYVTLPRLWRRREREKLQTVVISGLKEAHIRPHFEKREGLLDRKRSILKTMNLGHTKYLGASSVSSKKAKNSALNISLEDTELSEVDAALASCSERLREASAVPVGELCKDKKLLEKVDWLKISRVHFDEDRSADECRLQWTQLMQPSINRSRWTPQEDKKLKDLVLKAGASVDYDEIAKKLGTGRTAFQCCQHYQCDVNYFLSKGPWTEQEDTELMNLVQSLRIGKYIPWQKITYYMPGRMKGQIYARWRNSLDPSFRRGLWSTDEDAQLLALVKRFGTKNFPLISSIVKTRTASQCATRYRIMSEEFERGGWTKEDDQTLLNFVKERGPLWKELSEEKLKNRSRAQLRQRYVILKRNLEEKGENDEEAEENGEIDAPTRKSEKCRRPLVGDRRDDIQIGLRKIAKRSRSRRFAAKHAVPTNRVSSSKPNPVIDEVTEGLGLDKVPIQVFLPKPTPSTAPKKGHQVATLTPIDKEILEFFKLAYMPQCSKVGRAPDLNVPDTWVSSILKLLRVHPQNVSRLPSDDLSPITSARQAQLSERVRGSPDDNDWLVDQFEEMLVSNNTRAKIVPSGCGIPKNQPGPNAVPPGNDSSSGCSSDHHPEVGNCPPKQEFPEYGINSINSCLLPNMASLVGYRSLLLQRNNLKAIWENKTESLPSEELDYDLSNGQRRLSPHEADGLLTRRFLQMFLWTSLMEGIRPHETAAFNIVEENRASLRDNYRKQQNLADGFGIELSDIFGSIGNTIPEKQPTKKCLKRGRKTCSSVAKSRVRKLWKRRRQQQDVDKVGDTGAS